MTATIPTIQAIVCRVWRVDESVMTSGQLSPHFAQARQAAMHLARKHGCREVDVAAAFRRHKDTVSHAVRMVENRLLTDAAFRLLYEEAAAAARQALHCPTCGARRQEAA